MSSAVGSSVAIVAYLALFVGVGVLFLFVNLLVGWFVRPSDPHQEKLEIYECGEPTIGSSFVQFDLRFYVVALLFIIFDVEVAFFFPWAAVFGKSTQLMNEPKGVGEIVVVEAGEVIGFTEHVDALYRELGIRAPSVPVTVPASLEISPALNDVELAEEVATQGARQLALVTIVDILVFFAVLLVGFAYVWRRGDLDWVRAVSQEQAERGAPSSSSNTTAGEPAISA